jgi:bifunctional aspartokinase / homoserine dehydrogenase 1
MPSKANDIPFHVFKFGGTSVAGADRIRRVVDLIAAEPADARRVVIVSAFGGVTDRLIQAIEEALARTDMHREVLAEIRKRHDEAVEELVGVADREAIESELAARWRELGELLDGVYLLRECTLRTRDAILGMGERVSAPITAAAFRAAGLGAVALDAASFIRTDAIFGEATVQFDETNRLIQQRFEDVPADQVAIVTGFIASTDRGVLTTLGRSGSDYTATIIGGAVRAERVVIWTDVDGVLSSDPRLVPEAYTLPQLSYREAAELAYFGAKVLHPRTMLPLERQRIPLWIKNTMNPGAAGTLISEKSTQTEGHVKAVTAIRRVEVVMLEGTGLVGVPGVSARALSALAALQINVLMISQASSEQSLCMVVREGDAETAMNALRLAFELELGRGDVSTIYSIADCAVVSVVGDFMRERPGLAGRMFATLGKSGVNVLAIAQGASETNISAVIRDADVRQAVNVLHDEFCLVRHRVHVFIIGSGVVGTALIEMLKVQAPVLLDRLNLNLQLVGVANSRQLTWNVAGIPFPEALAQLEKDGTALAPAGVVDYLLERRLHRMLVVDATASDDVAHRYPDLLERSIAVITPNKRANTKDFAFYKRLQRAAHRHQVPYLYETTVGAGLPIITTLRDLVRSGDRIDRIEGVLSGTMGFIFNRLADGHKFSEAVRDARMKGYTEPDPRDDLRGEDVGRKLLILAREMGIEAERDDVAVESLVPAHLFDVSVSEFLDQLEAMDEAWEERVAKAAAEGGRLQYIGLIDEGRLSVRVRWIGPDSPFAHLQGTDNMVVYSTMRYNDNPLVVQGPGAGPVVTAAGLLADLIKAAELGA